MEAASFMYSTNFLYTAPSSHQLERYEPSHAPRTPQQTMRIATDDATSHDVDLVIRQEPKEALVTTEGKEKGEHPPMSVARPPLIPPTARKPVDPPPIVEIRVRTSVDPSQ